MKGTVPQAAPPVLPRSSAPAIQQQQQMPPQHFQPPQYHGQHHGQPLSSGDEVWIRRNNNAAFIEGQCSHVLSFLTSAFRVGNYCLIPAKKSC